MDTYRAPALAADLGVSLPRLHRVLATVPGAGKTNRGFLELTKTAVAEAKRQLGVIPKIDGFTREELQVLIALSRHPRGLVSQRQVASAASVSPTTAGKSLKKLGLLGLVEEKTVRLFNGSVQDRPVLTINWRSPKWREIAPKISRAQLPQARQGLESPHQLPRRLAATFWSGNWRDVDVQAQPRFVAHRILNEGRFDPEAISFLGTLPPSSVRGALREAR